jgi:hypothetical protein
MFTGRTMCGLTYVTLAALCSSCSLHKYVTLAALCSSCSLHKYVTLAALCSSCSLHKYVTLAALCSSCSLHKYVTLAALCSTWLGDYCECVQPGQLPSYNLNFELRPSWNNFHDTFPTGTVQDTTCPAWEVLPVATLLPALLSGWSNHASPTTTSK